MKLIIAKTLILSYRKLFILIIDNKGFKAPDKNKRVSNAELKIDMPIHSIEIVNLSNEKSVIGITINYQDQDQLDLLESLKAGDQIYID
ncbi:hypothetical protein D3C85_1329550 [compost metagenome]